MSIEKENIKNFINHKAYYQTPKEMIKSILSGLAILCVPTAIFGAYSTITSIIMLPITVWIYIWGIYILKKPLNLNLFNLFLTVIFVFCSLSFLILTYKFFGANNSQESLLTMGFILILYIASIVIYIRATVRLVKKGHFNTQEKPKNVAWISGCIAAFMIVCGRKILGAIDRDVLDNIMLFMFLFAAFACAYGATLYFLKYYFAKRLEE